MDIYVQCHICGSDNQGVTVKTIQEAQEFARDHKHPESR